jgi:hypothetical protein
MSWVKGIPAERSDKKLDRGGKIVEIINNTAYDSVVGYSLFREMQQ